MGVGRTMKGEGRVVLETRRQEVYKRAQEASGESKISISLQHQLHFALALWHQVLLD